jgi:tetratricopeptide (TPR) repeat protein
MPRAEHVASRRAASWRQRWIADPRLWVGLCAVCLIGAVTSIATGCSGWDPTDPFTRHSPEVNDALARLDAGDFESAEEVLATYLNTGPCGDAGIGLPPTVRQRPNGSFDLGLTLFHMAEKYGRRFGEEEQAEEDPQAAELAAQRSLEIDCAQIVVKAIASDSKVPIDLRARAYYLSGNLEFLRGEYEAAVEQYDQALELIPGLGEDAGGDEVGRDAAWNRAIALRRIREQQDAGPDAEPDSSDGGGDEQDGSNEPEAGDDASRDAEDDDGGGGGEDGGEDSGAPDSGDDEGDGGDDQPSDGGAQDGGDAGSEPDASSPPPQEDQPSEPERAEDTQMQRILDQLEEAPTYQEQEAKKRVGVRRRYRMEDK